MIEGNSNLQWMRPNEEGQKRIEFLRAAFLECEEAIREICNPSRESSLALTKLEECCNWAVKSVCIETKT